MLDKLHIESSAKEEYDSLRSFLLSGPDDYGGYGNDKGIRMPTTVPSQSPSSFFTYHVRIYLNNVLETLSSPDFNRAYDLTERLRRVRPLFFDEAPVFRTDDAEFRTFNIVARDSDVDTIKLLLEEWREFAMPVVCPVSHDRWACANAIERQLLQQNVGKFKIALLDTGASCHIWRHMKDFTNLDWDSNPSITGIGGAMDAEATGTLGNFGPAMFCPEVKVNILSVGNLTQHGLKAVFNKHGAILYRPDGSVYLRAHHKWNLWFCIFEIDSLLPANAQKRKLSINECIQINTAMSEMVFEGVGSAVMRNRLLLLHKAGGHPSWKRLNAALKNGLINADGLGIKPSDWRTLPALCSTCCRAKMCRARAPKKSKKRSTALFEQLHVDIADCTKSIGGFKYAMVIVDGFSNYAWVLFLKRKSEACRKLSILLRQITTGKCKDSEIFLPSRFVIDKHVAKIRTDGGAELNSEKFMRMCANYGATKLTTVPYSSHQNPRAERMIRSLFTAARAMRIDAKLPRGYWRYATEAACHVHNRMPCKRQWEYNAETNELSDPEFKVPFTLVSGRVPDVSYFKPFGCRCFVMRKPPKRKRKDKTAPVADEHRFLGYAPSTKGYVVQPVRETKSTKLVHVSKDICWDMREYGQCELQGSYKIKLLESKLKSLHNQQRITDFFRSAEAEPVLDSMVSGVPEGQGYTKFAPDLELPPNLVDDEYESDDEVAPNPNAPIAAKAPALDGDDSSDSDLDTPPASLASISDGLSANTKESWDHERTDSSLSLDDDSDLTSAEEPPKRNLRPRKKKAKEPPRRYAPVKVKKTLKPYTKLKRKPKVTARDIWRDKWDNPSRIPAPGCLNCDHAKNGCKTCKAWIAEWNRKFLNVTRAHYVWKGWYDPHCPTKPPSQGGVYAVVHFNKRFHRLVVPLSVMKIQPKVMWNGKQGSIRTLPCLWSNGSRCYTARFYLNHGFGLPWSHYWNLPKLPKKEYIFVHSDSFEAQPGRPAKAAAKKPRKERKKAKPKGKALKNDSADDSDKSNSTSPEIRKLKHRHTRPSSSSDDDQRCVSDSQVDELDSIYDSESDFDEIDETDESGEQEGESSYSPPRLRDRSTLTKPVDGGRGNRVYSSWRGDEYDANDNFTLNLQMVACDDDGKTHDYALSNASFVDRDFATFYNWAEPRAKRCHITNRGNVCSMFIEFDISDFGHADNRINELFTAAFYTNNPRGDSVFFTSDGFDTEYTNTCFAEALRVADSANYKTPANFEEAMKSEEWRESMRAEIKNLTSQGTFKIIPRAEMPPGAGYIGSKWVYKTKFENGTFDKRKSRLVGLGYSMREFRDYMPENVFAPVCTFENIRPLLAYGIANRMHCHHVDVDGAFLIAEQDIPLYMKLDDSLRTLLVEAGVKMPDGPAVIVLLKSIYGTKSAAHLWWRHLKETLTSKKLKLRNGDLIKGLGFKQNPRNECIFYREEPDKSTSIISTYVDDLVILTKTKRRMNEIKDILFRKYDMKNLGPIKWLLGTNIVYDRAKGIMQIDQSAYIKEIAKRFNVDLDCKPEYMPMSPEQSEIFTKMKHIERLEGEQRCDATKYRGIIGALLFISRATRPDIETAVHMCACASKQPKIDHMRVAKRILRYLVTTNDLCMTYDANAAGAVVTGYCDSDWGSREQDSRSRSGYCLRIGSETSTSAVAMYKSRLQKTPALSTAAAEYMAASDCCSEVYDMRENLKVFGSRNLVTRAGTTRFTTVYSDSKSATTQAQEPKVHHKTKSIRTRYHHIRSLVQRGPDKIIRLVYINTHDNPADLFTKILPKKKFILFRNLLMNINPRTQKYRAHFMRSRVGTR